MKHSIIKILSYFLFVSCGTNQVFIDQANQVRISKNQDTDCKQIGEYEQYYWLYGLYSINEPKFQSSKYKKIKIREKVTWKDILVTIPLGIIASVGRKTFSYQDCGDFPPVETEYLVHERNKILGEIEKEYKDLPQLLTERAKKEFGEKFKSNLPLIWFMDGSLKQGKVVAQDTEILEIEDEDGARKKFYKRDILKVRYSLD
ncbi:LIC_13076 family protein [Leptospira dzoumogneensis]|uniref:Uncharacterized protein n=1 Tax=Leptospira dzoumogneensis TaxID=2484904 RepID=A0A4Z1A8E1_9LEPT|nr:hypothetical protein [Leptospira dzoumogneensis]TGM95204.1 hypothetical protein EHR06_19050 [Leptospira dzoumogneensis]